jgi:hypothetical protein
MDLIENKSGGRVGTRTPGLLRVKNVVWFVPAILLISMSYGYANKAEKTEV